MSSPTTLPFTVYDVFTESRYAGNPLAVVSLPPSADFAPTQTQLQAIASEFNLSETIFLQHDTADDDAQAVRRARIFTTTREILFAGHPTIGAATHLLVHQLSTTRMLVPGAGPIPISLLEGSKSYVKAVVPHTYHQHSKFCPVPLLLALHPTISQFIHPEQTLPIVSIVHGMTWVLCPLKSLEALASAKLGNAAAMIMGDSGILDAGWEYGAPVGVYFFVRNGETGSGEGKEGVETVRTRYMVRQIEDPATGSAASALTGYLSLQEEDQMGRMREWRIVQGVEMGRRSEIGVRVEVESGRVKEIELRGTAVRVSEGAIVV